MIQTQEVRTFEQRFGKRCPFCQKSWGDPAPCGDSRADYSLRELFDRSYRMRRPRPAETDPVILAARLARRRALDREKTARYRERHQVTLTCGWCNDTFTTAKKEQRFCSISHAMRAWHAREELVA